ncbi:MAG TPA: serine hydrolase [Humisphaera sp.]
MQSSDALLAQLRTLCAHTPGTTVAVAVEDLGSGLTVGVNEAELFHPASTIKVALLATLYDHAARGLVALDERVPIVNAFASSIDGSPFELSADDDSDKTLYARLGQTETLRELARLAIVRSSNLGTNLLMAAVAPVDVTAHMRAIGAGDLFLRNRMMDMKAFEAKQTNRATARSLCRLMAAIALGETAGSAQMVDVLLGQEFAEGLPAGLPTGARVAHKTGSITAHYHDAGIVYPPGRRPYAIAVLTRGFASEPDAHRVVADVSRAAWEHLGGR